MKPGKHYNSCSDFEDPDEANVEERGEQTSLLNDWIYIPAVSIARYIGSFFPAIDLYGKRNKPYPTPLSMLSHPETIIGVPKKK